MKLSTLLGHVGAVAGSTISIKQYEGIASGIAIIGGRSYRVGQVGSFVRIPQGYHDLYGIISDVGASATPETLVNTEARGERWMKVQLVGEVVETTFERGISQYPAINDQVHLVVEEDLVRIYGTSEAGQVTVGRLSGAESIPVRIDLDKLVTRHSAVLGSTGAGKSTTVSSLLRSISAGQGENSSFPSARVLLIDIHGEYGKSLGDVAKVFRVNPLAGESPLNIPYWALNLGDLLGFVLGKTEEKAISAIQDQILRMKLSAAKKQKPMGVDENSLTADSPLPFSLKALWFSLLDPEIKTWKENTQITSAQTAPGDAFTLTAPSYPLPGAGNSTPFVNKTNVLSIRRQLDQLRSRLLDRQFDFMLHPGDWEPNLDGVPKSDLPELLENWIGHDKPITVLDLSGVPSSVLMRLIGGILNIIYEALFWSRERTEGGRQRPLLVVMEEAHRYLGQGEVSLARDAVQRIVKEGRKFGIGAMIVSQRPAEIDDTILSQCGTFFSLRLSNASDRSKVQAALPDSLSGVVDSLPVLRTGEAVITGEAAKLPVRCRVILPEEGKRPASEDPKVNESWRRTRQKEDYSAVVATWRSQNPRWKED
ncbi:ATP-binding protein [Pseudoxanthomonas sp.]|uniref:ATP-binding protein n=1 Tax=Pseudoxanthomonas sp. TaxID=1871049 RepID=UPI002616339F|nr:ATP-binding protein [Pseudoxanthomonas sp.]WDS35275.1 MAG: ATP-binding protein [Pseudoxanthomonas sp.]